MDPFFSSKEMRESFSQWKSFYFVFSEGKKKLSFSLFSLFFITNTLLEMNSLQVHQQKAHQPREKRLKVSRACFTCRVKKIKVSLLSTPFFRHLPTKPPWFPQCDGVQPCMQVNVVAMWVCRMTANCLVVCSCLTFRSVKVIWRSWWQSQHWIHPTHPSSLF